MGKFIFNFTPTGMVPTKDMTPHVPVSPEEIIRDTKAAVALGVNMVHLHARHPATGLPTADPGIYAEIVQGIRAFAPDLVIVVSTSGRSVPDIDARAAVLELQGEARPDMASLTLSSLNFTQQASINAPSCVQELARRMKVNQIRPELEVFDTGMVQYARYLLGKGIIEPPLYFNVILGNIASAPCTPLHLGMILHDIPPGSLWAAGGIGRSQLRANIMGLSAGGGVRTGLEDNVWWDDARTRQASNSELLLRVRDIAMQMGLTPYARHEVRDQLALPRIK